MLELISAGMRFSQLSCCKDNREEDESVQCIWEGSASRAGRAQLAAVGGDAERSR